jgi:DNA-binding NtrC family response regulator
MNKLQQKRLRSVARACARAKMPSITALDEFERVFLEEALLYHGDNRSATARALGLSRQGLYKKLDRHGIE